MNDIEVILDALKNFRDDRDWAQFHNPKDLAIAISIEASELLELYLWKDANLVTAEKAKKELADIFSFAFLLADKYELNIKDIILDKIAENELKYPVEKSKGSAKKYNEL